jgi:membrane protein
MAYPGGRPTTARRFTGGPARNEEPRAAGAIEILPRNFMHPWREAAHFSPLDSLFKRRALFNVLRAARIFANRNRGLGSQSPLLALQKTLPTPPISALPKAASPAPLPRLRRRSGLVISTVRYLMRTEVHTFAFSVAANAILSFFPFVMLLMTLIRRVLHSNEMSEVVAQLLRDYLPAGQDFVIRNLNAMVNSRQRVQIVSLVILLVTSSGIFLPLEVALNRIWRFPNNRSYFGNQLISLGLAFGCGVLALLSVAMTAGTIAPFEFLLRGHAMRMVHLGGFMVMKVFAVTASIAIFFLIYWVLPNGKVPARAVLPAAVIMGLLSEALKYAYILALPRLNFQEVYGPFALSVSLMFWAFLTGLLLLAGAHISAEEHVRRNPRRIETASAQ